MNLVGKKNPIHRRQKIFTDANLRKQQKEQYAQVSFPYVSMYKILHQANGVFKCNSRGSHKWTRSGQQVGLSNNALSCV